MELTRKLRRTLKRIVKDGQGPRVAPVHYRLNVRARTRAAIDRVQVNGRFALERSGRDCDCVQYRYVTNQEVPVSIIAWCDAEEEHERWLDGPEVTRYHPPVDEEVSESRDLVLEDYEDGHPHHILAPSL